MGVQAEAESEEVIYENCPYTRCQWSQSPQLLLTRMSQQQQQQYRDPPPYPGHSKQVFPNQPGLRQSFSGSETSTDVSLSSTENLATWQRQEPQGEETQAPLYQQLDDGSYSILARLGMPPGAIESTAKGGGGGLGLSSSQSSPLYSSPQSYYSYPSHSIYATSPSSEQQQHSQQQQQQQQQTNVYGSAQRHSLGVPTHWQAHGLPPPQSGHYSRSLTPTYHHPHPYVNQHWTPGGDGDSSDSGVAPSSSASSSQYVSALLPPPPQYPGTTVGVADNAVKVEQSRSQPDLPGMTEGVSSSSTGGVNSSSSSHRKSDVLVAHGQLGCHAGSEPVFSIVRSGSGAGSQDQVQQVVELLSEENRRLQAELAHCYKKVSKLQKFELEIQKVHEAYESLVKSSQKRERLETAVKSKLEEEARKLRSQNEELKAQLSQSGGSKVKDTEAGSLRRSQRDALDAKLAATQTSLTHLEEEMRTKDAQAGRMEKLQKAFSSLQTTSERRQEMEKQLRSQLQTELETYKSGEKRSSSGTSTPKEETKSVTALKQILSEKDTKILQLETEIVRWEQRYVEQQAMQQMEESSGPRQAHLAALEKSSAETEKLIDESKTEKLRHMEELYQSNRRGAELEAKVKWLQTQLQEKEAMVKVYQRAPPSLPTLPRSSSVHAICCSPHHSPRPSLIASTAYTRPSGPPVTAPPTGGGGSGGGAGGSGSYCDFVNVRHVKTGSSSALETGGKMSLDDTLTSQEEPSVMSKSDSEDEMRLWQV